MYDLLVKGGLVVDPAQGIHTPMDVAISRGRVAALSPAIAPGEATKTVDAAGMIVTPGLIDIHTHVAEAVMPTAVAPDKAGVLTGVTAVCDAGSTGYANFNGFRKLVIPPARTSVFCFLHLCPVGQAILPEIGWQNISEGETLRTIAENQDVVRGIKIRATGYVIEHLGVEAVETAKRIGARAGIPLAVHIGIGLDEVIAEEKLGRFTREMLSLLDKGDILVHVYTHRRGGVINPDGSLVPGLEEAIKRGIVLDVAHASTHFSFEIARMGMSRGILPDTLSTDSTATNVDGPVVFSLPVAMSKFLALGLSLDQVVQKTTVNPARILGEEQQRGSLRTGMPADISILEVTRGDFTFSDGLAGNTLMGEFLLAPRLTIKEGVEIPAQPRFRNYTPGEPMVFPKGI